MRKSKPKTQSSKPARVGRTALLARLRDVTLRLEAPAAGYHTTEEYARKWRLSRVHASKLIREGVAAGLLRMRRFRVRSGGRVYPVPHYAEK